MTRFQMLEPLKVSGAKNERHISEVSKEGGTPHSIKQISFVDLSSCEEATKPYFTPKSYSFYPVLIFSRIITNAQKTNILFHSHMRNKKIVWCP